MSIVNFSGLTCVTMLVMATIGCGTSPEQKLTQIVAANSEAAKAKLNGLSAIHDQTFTQAEVPPMDDDEKSLALNFDQHVETEESDYTPNEAFNATILSAETLSICVEISKGTPDDDLATTLRFLNHPEYFMMNCSQAAFVGADAVQGVGWVSMEEEFFFLDKVRYAVVVRAINHIEPVIVSFEDPPEFQRGSMECQAILFDLDQKKLLGGFHFSATNSADVTVTYDNATEAEEGLKQNLAANVEQALHRALREQFGKATFPESWRAE